MSSLRPTSYHPLRVAIVGAGVAGWTAALHLASQFASIDIYGESSEEYSSDIGVGVWNTGLDPLPIKVRQDLKGSFVDRVGYRVPNGDWLLQSELAENQLLFLPQNRLYNTLRTHALENSNVNLIETKVTGIQPTSDTTAGLELSSAETTGTKDYHLIVAADGLNSRIRQICGGTNKRELNAIQDRGYTVYRGNVPLLQPDGAFQTWGVGRNMRFATVPFENQQVWFATIENDIIEENQRKDFLLDAFTWHEPIPELIASTPTIMASRAVAHQHCRGPTQMGAHIVFLGDAFMTVDPILAQGFTVGMEGAYSLGQCVQQSSLQRLGSALQQRHEERLGRLICLLRATDLVQALGQPQENSSWNKAVRSLTRVTPQAVKRPLFDAVLGYSLGR